VPEHRTSAEVDNDDKKGIEPPRTDQHLIEPVPRVSVDIVDVVQIGQANLVQIYRVDIWPNVRGSLRRGGDVRHRRCKASLEFVFLKSANGDHGAL
jgi:hypothetical protein